MKLKSDNIFLGILLGILLPIIFAFVLFLIKFNNSISFLEFVKTILKLNVYTQFMSVSIFASNLSAFLLFLKFERIKTARGVFLSTAIYSIIIFLIKINF